MNNPNIEIIKKRKFQSEKITINMLKICEMGILRSEISFLLKGGL